jgi:hypothetical protein
VALYKSLGHILDRSVVGATGFYTEESETQVASAQTALNLSHSSRFPNPDFPRPGRQWVMTQFANRFGGTPEDYSHCFYALFLLAHGAASLLSLAGDEVSRDEVRRSFLAISNTLIQQNQIFCA